MRIAFTTSTENGGCDRALAAAADRLTRQGLRLTGVVQTNIQRPQRFHCDMDLRILPDGPVVTITQNLGAHARGCRLDAGALEQAVAEVAARIRRGGADALILNKFGKQEAEGRGFREAIAEALGQGMPVLLGMPAINRDSFLAFTGGDATELPCSPDVLSDWLQEQCVPA